jgi:hypothetical protein
MAPETVPFRYIRAMRRRRSGSTELTLVAVGAEDRVHEDEQANGQRIEDEASHAGVSTRSSGWVSRSSPPSAQTSRCSGPMRRSRRSGNGARGYELVADTVGVNCQCATTHWLNCEATMRWPTASTSTGWRNSLGVAPEMRSDGAGMGGGLPSGRPVTAPVAGHPPDPQVAAVLTEAAECSPKRRGSSGCCRARGCTDD